MRFMFDDKSGCYSGWLSHKWSNGKEQDITIIFDTGCTNTVVGMYFANTVLLEKAIVANRDLLYSKFGSGYLQTADGGVNRVIDISLSNVALSDYSYADRLDLSAINVKLNIDDKLLYTNGFYTVGNVAVKAEPYMLLGLDIIRYFESIVFTEEYVSVSKFDYSKYNSEVRRARTPSKFSYADRKV